MVRYIPCVRIRAFATALLSLTLSLLSVGLPGPGGPTPAAAAGTWGRLANPGFEGQRMTGVYFFTGSWLPGDPKSPSTLVPGYQYPAGPNAFNYTVSPADPQNLRWSDSIENRGFALEQMKRVGTNTVIMSYWGPPGTDRWAFWAPMQTSPQSQDELFDVAVEKNLLVMPAIESASGTTGCAKAPLADGSVHQGISDSYNFTSDFPTADDGSVGPGLTAQVEDLVTRYILHPSNPAWPSRWARMYDQKGQARYAINLLHVASNRPNVTDQAFASAFDTVANRVTADLDLTTPVGFTLDALPRPQTLEDGDCHGWQPWFGIHPETPAAQNGSVTALWSNDTHLDLFATDASGKVISTFWDTNGGYRVDGWFTIHPETPMAPGAPVTALWNGSTHLDMFVTDANGTVWSTWWDANGGYRDAGWFSIHPEMHAAPGAPVTALWNGSSHLDLFVTGADGTVQSTFFDAGTGYRADGWFPIHPESPAAPGTAITALWKGGTHLDLFATGADGVVRSTWFDANGGYRTDGWFAIHPETTAAPGAPVTALWNGDNHLDLFMTGQDGTVWSTYWDAGEPAGYRAGGWFSIHPETHVVSGAPVTAVWKNGTHLDLFVTDGNENVQTIAWDANTNPPGWGPGWMGVHPSQAVDPRLSAQVKFVPPPAAGVPPSQPVNPRLSAQERVVLPPGLTTASNRATVVSRGTRVAAAWSSLRRDGQPIHLDLFAVGADGVVQSTFWEERKDTYLAWEQRGTLGLVLTQQQSILGIQGFIPELARPVPEMVQFKQQYWREWLQIGLPVFFDATPGYDGHLVFPGSPVWGNNDLWRLELTDSWSSQFAGIAFNTWNGYTEGYTAVPFKKVPITDATPDNSNFIWIQRLFQLASAS